jgi:hypothetical protein
MTIANGSPILAADLNALLTTSLVAIQADVAAKDLAYDWTYRWRGLLAATDEHEREARFIAPHDLVVESVALAIANTDGTTTLTLESESGIALFPYAVTATGAGAGSTVKAARILFDNRGGVLTDTASILSNPAARTLHRGDSLLLRVTTTNALAVAGSDAITQATLVLRSRYRE